MPRLGFVVQDGGPSRGQEEPTASVITSLVCGKLLTRSATPFPLAASSTSSTSPFAVLMTTLLDVSP